MPGMNTAIFRHIDVAVWLFNLAVVVAAVLLYVAIWRASKPRGLPWTGVGGYPPMPKPLPPPPEPPPQPGKDRQ